VRNANHSGLNKIEDQIMDHLSTGTFDQAAGYEHLRDDKTKTPLRSKYESRPKKSIKKSSKLYFVLTWLFIQMLALRVNQKPVIINLEKINDQRPGRNAFGART